MSELSKGEHIFDLRRPLKIKGQGQTQKILKSIISNTAGDSEKVSIGVR